MFLLQVIVCVSGLFFIVAAQEWGYNDAPERDQRPVYWQINFPICGERRQSPINIETRRVRYDEDLYRDPLRFNNYDVTVREPRLENVGGHTVELELEEEQGISISGGGLGYRYFLLQFHLHWGDVANAHKGSEHTVDGRSYEAVIHFVHRREDLLDVSPGPDEDHGLAVVGVFVTEGAYNEAFQVIIDNLDEANDNEYVQLDYFPALRNLLPQYTNKYYRYSGSLTTPPCYQTVIWTVMRDPIEVSADQIYALRTRLALDSSESLGERNRAHNNFRPTQALNGRRVTASFRVTDRPDDDDDDCDDDVGVIIGVLVGGLAAGLIIMIFICCCCGHACINQWNPPHHSRRPNKSWALSQVSPGYSGSFYGQSPAIYGQSPAIYGQSQNVSVLRI